MALVRRKSILFAALVAALALTAVAVSHALGGSHSRLGPYPSLGTCSVFPTSTAAAADAPSADDQTAWNQDISQAPVDPNSDAYIAYINSHGGDMLHPDFGSPRQYGFPYSVVGKHAKRSKVHFTAYGDESTHGKYRIPAHAPVEGGNGASNDGDRHVEVVDRSRCKLYELGRAFFKGGPRHKWNADVGVIWNLRSASLRKDGLTSVDAAGLPIFPGLVRYDEAQAGAIHHAIRFTVDSSRDAWIHPASHCAGDTDNPSAPPMGLRLRLKAGFDSSGFTGVSQAIVTAMKHYGLILADNGSNWYISGSSDRRWPDETLNQLKTIPGSAFEVVRSAAPIQTC
jgi:hypothetical protein